MVRSILSVLCVEFSGGRICSIGLTVITSRNSVLLVWSLRTRLAVWGREREGVERERERDDSQTRDLVNHQISAKLQTDKELPTPLLSRSLSLHLPLSLCLKLNLSSQVQCVTLCMTQRLNWWNDITNLIYFTRVQSTSYIKYMPICRCVSTQKLNKQTRIFPTRYYLCLCNLEFNVVIKNNCSRFLSNKVWVIQTLALLIWYSRLESADCESEKSYHGVIKNFTSADERLPSFRRD